MQNLQKALGYTFHNEAHLRLALTHPSTITSAWNFWATRCWSFASATCFTTSIPSCTRAS